MDQLLDDWDTKIAALLPFFYDLTLHCGASILGWGVPGDGDNFFPDIYNLRLTHLSQKLYTEENQISIVQSEFIDSKLRVCYVFAYKYICRYVWQEVKEGNLYV